LGSIVTLVYPAVSYTKVSHPTDQIFTIQLPFTTETSFLSILLKMLTKSIVVLSTFLASPLSAAPISLSSLEVADFATNVMMTSGASQFALWVPTDGNTYSSSNLNCLNIYSSSVGSCNIASIDQVGVVDGYTCAFSGSNGWADSQTGTDNSGWMKVAPPQTITAMVCV